MNNIEISNFVPNLKPKNHKRYISPFNLFQNEEEKLIIQNKNASNVDIFNMYSYINNENDINIIKKKNISKKTIYNTLLRKKLNY